MFTLFEFAQHYRTADISYISVVTKDGDLIHLDFNYSMVIPTLAQAKQKKLDGWVKFIEVCQENNLDEVEEIQKIINYSNAVSIYRSNADNQVKARVQQANANSQSEYVMYRRGDDDIIHRVEYIAHEKSTREVDDRIDRLVASQDHS